MTKNEFLEGLRKALGNDLDRETVQENVAYYDEYMPYERLDKDLAMMKKAGINVIRIAESTWSTEEPEDEEVTADLGDPWVIAQTIIDAEEAKRGTGRNAGSSYTTANSGFSDPVYGDGGDYTREDYYDQNQGYQTHVHTFGFDTWWKKLLLILGIIGIIVLVVSIVGGIISLLAPILIPLVIIMLIIRLIGGSGRRW